LALLLVPDIEGVLMGLWSPTLFALLLVNDRDGALMLLLAGSPCFFKNRELVAGTRISSWVFCLTFCAFKCTPSVSGMFTGEVARLSQFVKSSLSTSERVMKNYLI
jgi:hypothetical protein